MKKKQNKESYIFILYWVPEMTQQAYSLPAFFNTSPVPSLGGGWC